MASNDLSMTFDHKVLKNPNLSYSMITSSKLHQHALNSVEKITFCLYFNNNPNRPLDDLRPNFMTPLMYFHPNITSFKLHQLFTQLYTKTLTAHI